MDFTGTRGKSKRRIRWLALLAMLISLGVRNSFKVNRVHCAMLPTTHGDDCEQFAQPEVRTLCLNVAHQARSGVDLDGLLRGYTSPPQQEARLVYANGSHREIRSPARVAKLLGGASKDQAEALSRLMMSSAQNEDLMALANEIASGRPFVGSSPYWGASGRMDAEMEGRWQPMRGKRTRF